MGYSSKSGADRNCWLWQFVQVKTHPLPSKERMNTTYAPERIAGQFVGALQHNVMKAVFFGVSPLAWHLPASALSSRLSRDCRTSGSAQCFPYS
eukprot:6193742-Pleurochrysis_carterae.AAC.1